MPATTDTGAQLLRAILADPADDTARLVYADWLQEHGDETRAEFIRVQCEIARLKPTEMVCERTGRVLSHAGGGTLFVARCRCRACSLARREYECGKRHTVWDWRPGIPQTVSVRFSRGFVSHVTLPAATFLGDECESCSGRGELEESIAFGNCYVQCDQCGGTGRTPGVAAELFARHPIERVAFPGLEPDHDSRERLPYQWHRIVPGDYPTGTPVPRHELPREVWDLMAGDRPRGTVSWKGYSTRDLALSALSDAGVRLGRKRAGLLFIPGCTPPHT